MRMRQALLLSVVWLSGSGLAQAQDLWKAPAVWATIGGNVADLATTEYAAAKLGPYGHEANPIMGNSTAQRVTVKSAMTALELWIVTDLAKHGHARAAKVIGWTTGLSLGAIAVHNVQVTR